MGTAGMSLFPEGSHWNELMKAWQRLLGDEDAMRRFVEREREQKRDVGGQCLPRRRDSDPIIARN